MLSEIINFLNFSENLACAGLPTKNQLMDIKTAGFRHVINLGLYDDPVYTLPGEADSLKALGLGYIHIPVLFNHPTRHNFDDFITVMEANRSEHIFVHCAMNMRASTFLGLYGMLRLNLQPEVAFEPMHRIWQPNATWQDFIDTMLARFATG